MTLRFNDIIKLNNINPYVSVSAAHAAKLKANWRRPLPVLVRINGQPEAAWRINMMPMGNGDFYLYLHGVVRKASSTQVGDRVQVELTFDDDYRSGPTQPMPSWFRIPLHQNPAAKQAWLALSPSRKKEVIRYLARLKSPAARERNLIKALQVLSGHAGRFMARDWVNGA